MRHALLPCNEAHPDTEALLSKHTAWQEEPQETDEFRDVSAKVDRREALLSLRKAADIINKTTQVRAWQRDPLPLKGSASETRQHCMCYDRQM